MKNNIKYLWKMFFSILLIFFISFQLCGCGNSKSEKNITIKDFEDLGFKYSEEISGGDAKYIRFRLFNDSGDSIYISNSLRMILYKFSNCEIPDMLIIANEGDNDYSDVGHGVNMSQVGIQNMYRIAKIISDNPKKTFSSCFPDELKETIEKHNLVVLIGGGTIQDENSKTESGIWNSSCKGMWNIRIFSKKYLFRNLKNENINKNICLGFFTGDKPNAALLLENPKDAIGEEGVKNSPKFTSLFNSLMSEISSEENNFDPETFKVRLTPESINALKAVLPYLDMP